MDIDKDIKWKEKENYKQMKKKYDIFQDYMVKCKCSHTLLFTGMKDRLICSHCGNYVYKDEKAKLRYKIKEMLK